MNFSVESCTIPGQERKMASFLIVEGGGRVCNEQKFNTGRISRVY